MRNRLILKMAVSFCGNLQFHLQLLVCHDGIKKMHYCAILLNKRSPLIYLFWNELTCYTLFCHPFKVRQLILKTLRNLRSLYSTFFNNFKSYNYHPERTENDHNLNRNTWIAGREVNSESPEQKIRMLATKIWSIVKVV